MGVDLTFMPSLSEDRLSEAHDLISVERSSGLWPDIKRLVSKELEKPISCFYARNAQGKICYYGETDTDPYGGKLCWVKAAQLKMLRLHPAVTDNWKNRAVWAYLEQMPDNWPVVLYWH